MTCIEIDLEDYKDEIKYTFCNNNNCLKNLESRSFRENFKQYLDDLEKEIYLYRSPTLCIVDIFQKLQDLYNQLL